MRAQRLRVPAPYRRQLTGSRRRASGQLTTPPLFSRTPTPATTCPVIQRPPSAQCNPHVRPQLPRTHRQAPTGANGDARAPGRALAVRSGRHRRIAGLGPETVPGHEHAHDVHLALSQRVAPRRPHGQGQARHQQGARPDGRQDADEGQYARLRMCVRSRPSFLFSAGGARRRANGTGR